MKSLILKLGTLLMLIFISSFNVFCQPPDKLSVYWEELTSPDFKKSVDQSDGVCLLPIGVVEKHGPHGPLGTDMYGCREVAKGAADEDYCVIFPYYYFGQIFEARHQPGTIAYSAELQMKILEETCDEIHRNGFTKIILVNGHGGNGSFLPYFCQSLLRKRKEYVVYLHQPGEYSNEEQTMISKLSKAEVDGHAGESETSRRMVHQEQLQKLEKADSENFEDKNRLAHLEDAYTAIWWYGSYPNHYAGPAKYANKELGKLLLDAQIAKLVATISSVKNDSETKELQDQFYNEAENPLQTPQNK